MTSAAHVRLTQADIDEATREELVEDEYGYSLSKCSVQICFFPYWHLLDLNSAQSSLAVIILVSVSVSFLTFPHCKCCLDGHATTLATTFPFHFPKLSFSD